MRPKNFKSYALLGSGRIARHLKKYLAELGLPFVNWSRNGDIEHNTLSEKNAEMRLSQTLKGASHVLLAVKDDAIAALSKRAFHDQTVVHFSGALHLDRAVGAHPLMTFGENLHSFEWYKKVPFVIDQGVEFSQVLPGFPNPHHPLSPDKRIFYHALCSLAGNSTFMLWKKIGDEFESSLSLPRTLLEPFLHQVVENSSRAGKGDFTGPVARGDWAVVQSHIESLAPEPSLKEAYKSYLDLASRSGIQLPEGLK